MYFFILLVVMKIGLAVMLLSKKKKKAGRLPESYYLCGEEESLCLEFFEEFAR